MKYKDKWGNVWEKKTKIGFSHRCGHVIVDYVYNDIFGEGVWDDGRGLTLY